MLGYIKRHWRGENSLAWAYWINGVVLNAVVNIAFVIAEQEKFFDNSPTVALLAIVGIIIFTIWALVGIWRSASASIETASKSVPKRTSFWAYAAKVMVVVGLIRALTAWVPVMTDLTTAYKARQAPVATQFYIQYRDTTDVILNGYINERSVSAVKDAFLKDKNRTALVLNSPGGILLPAFDLADFVEKREIIVAAAGECVSSCLVILAAAKSAFVTSDAVLVFHHPEKLADFVSEAFNAQSDDEIKEYYARFRRYGVPEAKLAEFRKRSQTKLSIGEAYNAHLIDMIWDPIENKVHDPLQFCKRVDCFATPIKLH